MKKIYEWLVVLINDTDLEDHIELIVSDDLSEITIRRVL